MSIEKALLAVLNADAAVVSKFSTRLYSDELPDPVSLPALSMLLLDSSPIHGVREQTDWHRATVQIDVYGTSKQSVVESADAVKAALRRWRGPSASVVIDDTMLESERADYDVESKTRRVSLDFIVYFQE